MFSVKRLEDLKPIFDGVQCSDDLISVNEIDASGVKFPRRTIPYHLVRSAIIIPTLEALARNRKEHYAPPGQIVAMNRLWTFDKLTPSLREFKARRASHAAVEQIYHHEYGVWNRDTFVEKLSALAEDLTWNTDHALGLIGRFNIVRAVLCRVLGSGKVRSLGSIACGAGEVVADALRAAPQPVMGAFFDINREALDLAQKRMAGYPLVHYFLLNVTRHQHFFSGLPFEALELTGLIDYLPDDALVAFLSSLRQDNLKFLLTSNILRKPGFSGELERAFLYHALQWNMIYRTHDELRDLFSRAGYQNVSFFDEPYGLFTVIVWRKT